MQSYDIPLHDIKPIVEVQEYSLYLYVGFLLLGAFVVGAILFIFYKWFTKRRAFNLRAEYKKHLHAIDTTNAKEAAYAITLYGQIFQNDSPRHHEMYLNLTQRLQAYKYKKEVAPIDKETLGYFSLYKEMCDV
jgi:ABC-type sugar transport system permease subunit